MLFLLKTTNRASIDRAKMVHIYEMRSGKKNLFMAVLLGSMIPDKDYLNRKARLEL